MAYYVLAPRWFFGLDLIIDLVSLITLILIAHFTYKSYRLSKGKRSFLYLSMAFSMLAISFMAKMLSHFLIYYYPLLNLTRVGLIERIVETPVSGFRTSYLLFSLAFSLFRLLHLLGLYLLYVVYEDRISKGDLLIMFSCFFLITYFSNVQYFAFHIVALILSSLIAYRYYKTYRKNHNSHTKLLFVSFAIIAASQAIFIFSQKMNNFYVYAEFIQLFGYITLLATFMMVLYNGKKKK